MQTSIVIVAGSIINASTVHLNGIGHLIWRYISKPVLGGHPVLSGHYSIPRGCPLNTGFTVICCAKEARPLIVLDIEWVQFVLQNCEKLQNYRFHQGKKRTSSVRGLYDKKGPHSTVYLRRDEKSMFKRLVYTLPDSWPRFNCKVNLSNTKNPAWFFILASVLDRGMQHVNWLPPRTIVARVFLKIIFRGCPIIHSLLNGAMMERLVNATLWCNS